MAPALSSNGANGRSQANGSNTAKTSGNGHNKAGSSNGGTNGTYGDDLDDASQGWKRLLAHRCIATSCGSADGLTSQS